MDLRQHIRRITLTALALAALSPGVAAAHGPYVSGRLVIGLPTSTPARTSDGPLRPLLGPAQVIPGARLIGSPTPGSGLLRLPAGVSVAQAISRLRASGAVRYAVPDFVAHADNLVLPDDRGINGQGWAATQWNFLPGAGVNAPAAWANLLHVGHPGGRGVTVAVLDTGVAYRDWRRYRISPEFTGVHFVSPYDFVSGNPYPLDREGHGTFVTGTIAETTDNGLGLTGLAYGVSIMPLRVLATDGTGDSVTIARGIRYAVQHGAQIINLSLEFSLDVSAGDIPDILAAIRYAHQHGVVVIAASGNEGVSQLAYPARATPVISVGATTADRCLGEYSNGGPQLDLVAPGGGNDSALVDDPNCHPQSNLPTIHQMTLLSAAQPGRFGYPDGVYGTSMATPHVAAVAALIIASGVIGRHPTPDQILTRLEQTAQHLGAKTPNSSYGWGLVDAGAATAPITASGARSRSSRH